MPLSAFDHFSKLCHARKSVRAFSNKPVSPIDIDHILTITRTSPYASGRKNWDIKVLSDKTVIHQLADLVRTKTAEIRREIRQDFQSGFDAYAANFTAFESAPFVLIPTFRVSPSVLRMAGNTGFQASQWERENDVKSISCVCLLMLLTAQSLGLASCYMTGPLIAADAINRIVTIKNGHEISALIPIGYPEEENPREPK